MGGGRAGGGGGPETFRPGIRQEAAAGDLSRHEDDRLAPIVIGVPMIRQDRTTRASPPWTCITSDEIRAWHRSGHSVSLGWPVTMATACDPGSSRRWDRRRAG